MTEADWLGCEEPKRMLDFLRGKASDRKLRLFACACARRAWSVLTGVPGRRAVEVAEAFADGEASPDRLRAARRSAMATRRATRRRWVAEKNPSDGPSYVAVNAGLAGAQVLEKDAAVASSRTAVSTQAAMGGNRNEQDRKPHKRAHCHLLRDIFGDPFRPVTLATSLRAPAVITLASAAYNERALPAGHLDLARLAVLSDALEEAGCTDTELLAHLRGQGPHVRGCWALDLVLGQQ